MANTTHETSSAGANETLTPLGESGRVWLTRPAPAGERSALARSHG